MDFLSLNCPPFSYLKEAAVALDKNDPITKEHAPKILRELNNTFQTDLASNPNNSSAST